MHIWQRLFEWYFNIPAAQPGQGTAWSIHYDVPWPNWLPTWCVLLGAAAIVYSVSFIYQRDAAGVPLVRRIVLVALRLSLLVMLILFLSGMRLTINRIGLPVVALLIDDSGSMTIEDVYPRAADEEVARRLVSENNAPSHSRWNIARSLLLSNDGQFLQQILDRHKLRVYCFSETAVSLGTNESVSSDNLPPLVTSLSEAKPEGTRTRPGPAVQKVLDDLRGSPPAAIVIVSDGITSTTDADRLTQGAKMARGSLVPIYTVGIGSEEPTRDIELYDLLVDDVAFVNDPLAFTATVTAHGHAGKTVTATLKVQGSDEVLASKPVRLVADSEPVTLELPYAPPKPGEFDYVVAISPEPGETNKENNAEIRHVSVREEKIRVLLVDSAPRWEFRFVKHLLEREPTVEVRTVLFEADNEYVSEDATALTNFPVTREELFRYDVVILGDVNPGFLSSTAIENVRDFVRDAGGGLIVVAGPRNVPLSFRGTSLEALLPIELEQTSASGDLLATEGFRPQLTVDGRKGSPIFRFPATFDETSDVWDSLPLMHWLFESPVLRPGSRVFAEYRPPGTSTDALPVIAMAPFGGGKVLYHATDELWRWRYRAGDLYYGRYWVQALRFLSRSKLLGRDRNAELTVDRLVYQQGEPVNLRVRFLDERMLPPDAEGVRVAIERRGDVSQTVTLTRRTDAPNVFEGQWRSSVSGSFHAWVSSPSFTESAPSADYRVEAPRGELERRSLDRQELEQAALITHGRFYRLSDASRLPEELPDGSPMVLKSHDPIPLWNRPELLGLFALLLTGEWILRKRSRLI